MNIKNATGYKINDIKIIDGTIHIVKVGAFFDKKTNECFTQLRWYVPTKADRKLISKYKEELKP